MVSSLYLFCHLKHQNGHFQRPECNELNNLWGDGPALFPSLVCGHDRGISDFIQASWGTKAIAYQGFRDKPAEFQVRSETTYCFATLERYSGLKQVLIPRVLMRVGCL
jgi:hypothetical protein